MAGCMDKAQHATPSTAVWLAEHTAGLRSSTRYAFCASNVSQAQEMLVTSMPMLPSPPSHTCPLHVQGRARGLPTPTQRPWAPPGGQGPGAGRGWGCRGAGASSASPFWTGGGTRREQQHGVSELRGLGSGYGCGCMCCWRGSEGGECIGISGREGKRWGGSDAGDTARCRRTCTSRARTSERVLLRVPNTRVTPHASVLGCRMADGGCRQLSETPALPTCRGRPTASRLPASLCTHVRHYFNGPSASLPSRPFNISLTSRALSRASRDAIPCRAAHTEGRWAWQLCGAAATRCPSAAAPAGFALEAGCAYNTRKPCKASGSHGNAGACTRRGSELASRRESNGRRGAEARGSCALATQEARVRNMQCE